MAQITGFPSFGAPPTVTDFSTAAQKFLQQIGGVGQDGTVYQGNIDLTNFPSGGGYAKFRNEQKKEPYSEFGATVGWGDTVAGPVPSAGIPAMAPVGPWPYDVQLVAVCYHAFAPHAGTVVLGLGETIAKASIFAQTYSYPQPADLMTLELPSDQNSRDWPIVGLVPAGSVLSARVNASGWTPSVTDPWYVTFVLKALQRRTN